MKFGGRRNVYTEPPDGGFGWIIILSTFCNLMLILGQVNSLGICLANWKEDLDTTTSLAAGVISSLPAIVLTTNLLASYLSRNYGERIVMFFGGLIASSGCILVSFSTNIFYLYLTVGLLGVGYGLVFQPTIVMPAYYFKKRYVFANGFMFAGVGVGTILFPPIIRILIDQYSWRGTFFILGGVSLNMCVVSRLMCPVKFREKHDVERDSKTKGIEMEDLNDISNDDNDDNDDAKNTETSLSLTCTEQKVNIQDKQSCFNIFLKKYIKESAFWYIFTDGRRSLFVAVMFCIGLSSFPVFAHLPYRATVAGIPEQKAAFLMSVLGMTSLVSRLLHGWIVDKQYISIRNLYALSLFVAGVICMLCTVSDSYTWLLSFSVIFGLASGIYNPLLVPYVRELVGDKKLSTALSVIYPVFGVTATFSGFFTGWLYDYTGNYDVSFYFAGGAHIIAGLVLCMDPLLMKLKRNKSIDRMKKLEVDS